MTFEIPECAGDVSICLPLPDVSGQDQAREPAYTLRSYTARQILTFNSRQRKVGCNYEKPCQKCADRNHPELCLYEPVWKRPKVEATTSYQTVLQHEPHVEAPVTELDGINRRLSTIEQSIQELRDDLRYFIGGQTRPAGLSEPFPIDAGDRSSNSDPAALGMHTSSAITGETVHLGGNSVPAMVLALTTNSNEDTIRNLSGRSVLPLFGLDNETATYPFVDLWGMPHESAARIDGLCRLLPNDADCLQYFRQYRDTAHVLFPGVVDIAQFESDLTHFLITRAAAGNRPPGDAATEQNLYGKSLHWVGLLFATLASGCQCSSAPRKERQLTCQVYGKNNKSFKRCTNISLVCCAYECLRIINYLSHSTLYDIQNLLVLGNVISNNMNAGVTWCLLGITIRLGQSLGLHRPCPSTTSAQETAMREEVWWRIVWQDSLISITYDRASATPTISHHNTIHYNSSSRLSYVDCMKNLCEIGLLIVQERTENLDHRQELHRVRQHQDEIAMTMSRAYVYLQDANASRSIRDQVEHWNLYMHRSYILSELYRPGLRRRVSPEVSELRQLCIESLANTVEAFLGLQNVTRFATQSWAAVHRSLSSALLLGILKQPAVNERVRILLDRLVGTMSNVNSELDPSEISAPVSRSVLALSQLNSTTAAEIGFKDGTPGVTVMQLDKAESDVGSEEARSVGQKDSDKDNSPHGLMERILWGKQQQQQQLVM